MPEPSLDPTPLPPCEVRFGAPAEAQDASYFAASARMASLERRLRRDTEAVYSSRFVPSRPMCSQLELSAPYVGVPGIRRTTTRYRPGAISSKIDVIGRKNWAAALVASTRKNFPSMVTDSSLSGLLCDVAIG